MAQKSRWNGLVAVAGGIVLAGSLLAPGADAARRAPRHAPGELIVAFDPGIPHADREAMVATVGGVTKERLPVPGARLVEVSGTSTADAVAELRGRPGVAYAQPNFYREATATPNDEYYAYEWALHNTGQLVEGTLGTSGADIDAPPAWDVTTGSSAVTVAVADTGIDYLHPDLASNIWSNPGETAGNSLDDDGNGKVDDIRGWDFAADDNDPIDEHYHGTHVAGTIGAQGNNSIGIAGVAWDVSLMPVRVLGANGFGTDANIGSGFAYAAEEGADVVNASIGGNHPAPFEAAAIAAHPSTLYVAAAGNESRDVDATPSYPCSIPEQNLICVAATNQSDQPASFSNWGLTSVDLAAPGVNIASTVPSSESSHDLLSEGFESGLGSWTTGGTSNWATTDIGVWSGALSLTDSPSGNYAPNTDSFAQSPPIDASDASSCEVAFDVSVDTESAADFLHLEGSADGATGWNTLATYSGIDGGIPTVPADVLAGASSGAIRFRLTSDGSTEADGVVIDDVKVRCVSPDPPNYVYLDGTSMAAPQVAGAAALLLAHDPGMTVAQLRSALLGTVDVKASLADTSATGGRLNIAAALSDAPPDDTTPPQTTITKGPKKKSSKRKATFQFSSNEAASTFRCRMDSKPWATCNPPQSYTLKTGQHKMSVSATDQAGNTDPTPATYAFKIVKPRR